MELKDLPDSELPVMEAVYAHLVTQRGANRELVWIELMNKGFMKRRTDDAQRDADRRKAYSMLELLADWEFAERGGVDNMREWAFKITEFKHSHRPLAWHREQAILKHKQQRKQRGSEIRQRVFNYAVTIVGIGLVVAQVILTVFDNKDDKGTQREIDHIRYEVDSLSRNQAADSKLLHDLSSLSTSGKDTIFSKDQKVDSVK
jgi:hypothetical protein